MKAPSDALVTESPSEAANGSPTAKQRGRDTALDHLPLLGVLLAFAAAAFVIPTLAPVAISDDWIYSLSVRSLVEHGEFRLLPVSAANAVFQILWGSAFASVFGFSLGVLRLSTVVLVGLSGWAFYGCCRELALPRSWSALGVAAYLFCPLTLPLTYTFMTDPHFVAVTVVAIYGYLRGLRGGPGSTRVLLLGSVAAAAAASNRPQGVLLVAAVVFFLIATRRVRPDMRGLRTLLAVAGVPLVTTIGLYAAFAATGNAPATQSNFFDSLFASSAQTSAQFVAKVVLIAVVYVGLFAAPVLLPALLSLPTSLTRISRPAWRLVLPAVPLLLLGVLVLASQGRLMPYSGQFFNPFGFNPGDLVGLRARVFGLPAQILLTTVCLIAAGLLLLLRAAPPTSVRTAGSAGAGLLGAIGLSQLIGVALSSFYFLVNPAFGPTLDRYLLPLVPISVGLALWLVMRAGVNVVAAWVPTVLMTLISIMGTRDSLTFQRETWDLAREAQVAGVPLDRLDGGAAWDGWHLYKPSQKLGALPAGSTLPFWIPLFGLALDPRYTVANSPPPETVVIAERNYSQWLNRVPQNLYLVRRAAAVDMLPSGLPPH